MTVVGTALNLGGRLKIYPQVLTSLIKPQIWVFHVVVAVVDDGKEMDKNETRTCRAWKTVVFVTE